MIAFVVRTLGLLVFAAAFVALVADGVRSLASDQLLLTPLRDSWTAFDQQSLTVAGDWVTNRLSPTIWSVMTDTLLAWPTFAVAGVLGILLMLAGRRRRRRRTLA